MTKSILSLSRAQKTILIFFADIFTVIGVLYLSLSLRLGSFITLFNDFSWIFFCAPIFAIPIFYYFGLYKLSIRYIGFNALWSIFQAASLYSFIWGVFLLFNSIEGFPRSVIVINWILSVFAIISLRMIARWLLTTSNTDFKKNVLIYGAGSAGRQLAIALKQSDEYHPVSFIDDSEDIQKQSIYGLEVMSPNNLSLLIKNQKIKEVLLAITDLSRSRRNAIIELIRPYSVIVRSLPSVSLLVEGKVKIDDLREVNIKDLLGREPVKPNKQLLEVKITHKVVLVTGAGGSIGSEICRQIILLNPTKLILFDNSEYNLYQIEQQLCILKPPGLEIVSILGSVTDKLRIQSTLELYGVNTIYHAAAYKHVPLVETNPSQGVFNNSIGTFIAAQAAIDSKVETFVLISTDKAVRPTSTMGASKRVAELVIQALAKISSSTCLTMVRFGNVLDSSGSVIPLFKKQIKNGGPLTVTDINMVRYFMTIPEAVELVIQAGAMGEGGEVFVLDMGKPVKIQDLAEKMIQLSGRTLRDENTPNGDIEIKYIGLRPGEKLYEELLVSKDNKITENPLITRAEEEMINWETLLPLLNQLKDASIRSDHIRIRELLKELVPEFKPQHLI